MASTPHDGLVLARIVAHGRARRGVRLGGVGVGERRPRERRAVRELLAAAPRHRPHILPVRHGGQLPLQLRRIVRILLTGASGYLGQHLLRELLARGHTLTAAVRDPARLGAHAGAVRVWSVDLDEPEAVARAPRGHDALVHAALIWGPEGAEHRDTAAAARLFALPVERAVYVSSAAVHRPFAPVMSEDDPVAPVDPYGATKRAGELALRAAYGPRGVVIRPGPLVGPPAWPGAPIRTDRRLLEVARLAKEGLPIEVARGDGRQFSDVRAVARAVGALVSASDPHPTYLCVDREVTPWARVAEWAAAAAGSSSEVVVRDPAQAAPRFRTERVEGLIGGPASAEEALKGHLRWLFAG